jgi:hypothetical protein
LDIGSEHLSISSRELVKNVTIDPSIRELIGKSRPAGLAFSIAGPVTGRTSVSELRVRTQPRTGISLYKYENISQCKIRGFHGGDYEECRFL